MRIALPLSMLTVAVLSGCSSVDLKPVTKASNPRIVERDLAPPKPVTPRPEVRTDIIDLRKASRDETADLPVMPSKRDAVITGRVGPADQTGKLPAPAVANVAATKQATLSPAPNGASQSVAGSAEKKPVPLDPEKISKDQVWQVKSSDVRLAATFERWAKQSGERGKPFSILWDAGKHVLIEAPTEYRGSFLDAVEQALQSPSIAHSDYPLEACEYPNSPPVIRVTRLGEQAKDCPEYR